MTVDYTASFMEAAEKKKLNVEAVAVYCNGEEQEKRRIPDEPHVLHSLSKSFTSIAIGMLIDEGKLSLDTAVKEVLNDKMPINVTKELTALDVRSLLTMSSGHPQSLLLGDQLADITENDWVKYYLKQPQAYMPGEKFVYDTGCTFILSAMLQRITGYKLADFLQPRLFDVLGIERPHWNEWQGINVGGDGLFLRTYEILQFGKMLLNKGVYHNTRVVSEVWINESTKKQISTAESNSDPDWKCGYGYQFWCCTNGSYRADGAHGQYCIVLNDLNAVIAINSMEDRLQEILNTAWEEILPKIK